MTPDPSNEASGVGVSTRVRWSAPGRASHDILAEVLGDLRGADPLAPALVIVSSNPMGVALRRALGRRPGGIANVAFQTLERVALDLAGPKIEAQGRRRRTDQALVGAVRVALRNDPGPFGRSIGEPSTWSAVAASVEAVRLSGPAGLEAIERAGSGLGRHAVRIAAAVEAQLGGSTYDDCDLLVTAAAAATAAASATLAATAGAPIVVFHPEPLGGPAADLLKSLLAARRSEVIALASGDPAADEGLAAFLSGLLAHGSETRPPGSGEWPAATWRTFVDADGEARHAVRVAVSAIERGVSPARIGIGYPVAHPYAAGIHAALEAAGVAASGPSPLTMGDTYAGRVVSRLFGLALDGTLERGGVMALIAAGPLRSAAGSGPVRAARWDSMSRRAGVVAGIESWRERLGRAGSAEGETSVELLGFVEALAGTIERLRSGRTWDALATAAVDALDALLPGPASRAAWPAAEADSLDQLQLTLSLLSSLDSIDPEPDLARFAAAVEVELAAPAARLGPLGRGVVVGPVASLVGLDLDVAVVVGLVEGLAPRVGLDDVVLGRADASAVNEVLGVHVLGPEPARSQLRRFRIAIGAASVVELTASTGDLGEGRTRARSRWWAGPILDPVSHLGSLELGTSTWSEAALATVDLLGVRDAADVASLAVVSGDRRLCSGLSLLAERRCGFGPSSGDVSSLAPLDLSMASATTLEAYARCPFSYFLGSVLGLRDDEAPDPTRAIDPRTRGQVVHHILERFMSERFVGSPPRELTSDDRGRLDEITAEALEALHASGRGGRAVFAGAVDRDIRRRIDLWVALELEHRSTAGVEVLGVEWAFGPAERVPSNDSAHGPLPHSGELYQLRLPSGRSLTFRGRVDRVDLVGSTPVVIDYKTSWPPTEGDALEAVASGAMVQLGIYAGAVAQSMRSGTDARAEYWHLAGAGGVIRVDLGDHRPQLEEAIDEVASAIESGLFPQRPGAPSTWPRPTFDNCAFCAFDRCCPQDRDAAWERASEDPRLERYIMLSHRSDHDGTVR